MSDRGLGKLWIANCTMQTRIFFYRLDFIEPGTVRNRKPSYRQLEIASGSQGFIEINVGNADEVVGQLCHEGAIEAKELPRTPGLVPYVYSVDKKVPPSIIKDVHAHNTGLKIMEGRERRKLAAVGAAQAIAKFTGNEVPEIKVDMEQLDVSENDEERIEEGFQVKRRVGPGDRPVPPAKARTRRRAA